MKKLIVSASTLALLFASCGPAAENREMMHSRAKTIADSMANIIHTAMQEAESPPNVIIQRPDTAARPNGANTPANPPAPANK
jgi:hypothetical protein